MTRDIKKTIDILKNVCSDYQSHLVNEIEKDIKKLPEKSWDQYYYDNNF